MIVVSIKPGSRGADVGQLQDRLKVAGYQLATTHVYDEGTVRAVMALQADKGLVVDGIFGPKSFMALMGSCQPKHLGHADLVRAAEQLALPLASVRAVNEVESHGQGFLGDGRPAILFERHVFYQRLQAAGIDAEEVSAKSPDICAPAYGGYQGGAAEYIRLERAKQIHLASAYESASWGIFQIMGYHWKDLGYESVFDFVRCMQLDEAAQLDAFVRFIAHHPALQKALKARKWAAFAEGYNGPDYARNFYDAKLAQAYDKYTALEYHNQEAA